MKKKISLLMLIVCIIVLTLCLASCNANRDEIAENNLTINVPSNQVDFFLKLKGLIKEDLGINLDLVLTYEEDTTTRLTKSVVNGTSTDLVYSSIKLSDDVAQQGLHDLASTAAANSYTTSTLNSYSVGTCVYQLPISTTLIGITYNKTLFEEENWDIPSSYNELVALKSKVETAGYEFSSCNKAATGFGFNYLFHFAGVEYLSGPNGTQWLNDFISGKDTTANELEGTLDYIEQLKTLGLFDNVTNSWTSSYTNQHRCAFYVGILGGSQYYSGYRIADDNYYYGATKYNALLTDNGTTSTSYTITENIDGEYVIENGVYVPYDPNITYSGTITRYSLTEEGKLVVMYNTTPSDTGHLVWIKDGLNSHYENYSETNNNHVGLQRLEVDGALYLEDEYGLMPFISRSGTNNCFTTYDSTLIGISNKLEQDGYEDKLENAEKVLYYIATSTKVQALLDTSATFIGNNEGYTISESKMYYDYKSAIQRGFTMPWYYQLFSNSVIDVVGQRMNAYISNTAITFEDGTRVPTKQDVIHTLEHSHSDYLSNNSHSYGTIGESLNCEQTAEFRITSAAVSLQKELDKYYSGENKKSIDVLMIPYAKSLVFNSTDELSKNVCRSFIEKGIVNKSELNTLLVSTMDKVVAVQLTGKQIKDMANAGYDLNANSDKNQNEPWKIVYVKDSLSLEDNKNYIVAMPLVNATGLTIITNNNGSNITVSTKEAVVGVLTELQTVYLKDIKGLIK